MIVCTACYTAVPAGLTSCIQCGADVEPAPEGEADTEVRWGVLRTYSTELEARLVAGRLNAHGIPACVLSQVDSTRNFTVGALAVAKVFVPDQEREAAEQVLALPGLDADEE